MMFSRNFLHWMVYLEQNIVQYWKQIKAWKWFCMENKVGANRVKMRLGKKAKRADVINFF